MTTTINSYAPAAVLAAVTLTAPQAHTALWLARAAGHAWALSQFEGSAALTDLPLNLLGIRDATHAAEAAGVHEGGIACPEVVCRVAMIPASYGPGDDSFVASNWGYEWDVVHTTGTRGTDWSVAPDGSATIKVFGVASPAPGHNGATQEGADYEALMGGAERRLLGTAHVSHDETIRISLAPDCPPDKAARLAHWARAATGHRPMEQ